MNSSYMPISQFGNTKQNQTNFNDPLTFCLADTMDKNFQHGAMGVTAGPRSSKCQAFMAERCANKWDGFCEYFYRKHRSNNEWPNTRVWPDTFTPKFWTDQTSTLTIGDQLLKNAAETKYCEYPACAPYTEPFDPTNPNSAKVTYWRARDGSGGGCIPVCRVNPATVNDDVVMNHMLANPNAASNTIINICNTSRREGTDLSGTKLGRVCDRYFKNMGQ